MCLKTVGEAKTMKDYRVVRKYNILKINGKERLIRPVDEKMLYCITLKLTNCLIFFTKHILPSATEDEIV